MTRRPAPAVAGVLLAPGAGAGAGQPALVAIDAALTRRGWAVHRVDFPNHREGRRRPDPPAVLMATIRDGARDLAARLGVTTAQLVLGGRSMGGRICSQAVAEGLPAAGLVMVSYPLHPPGRPDRPRTAHLGALHVPCLFVSGTRDAFGTPEELARATALVPGPVDHIWVEGADHGLRSRDAEVASDVAAWVAETFAVARADQGPPRERLESLGGSPRR
ncbi:MAG: alpha/beta hydrolase family protein [Acidimicrobiales bacterium]